MVKYINAFVQTCYIKLEKLSFFSSSVIYNSIASVSKLLMWILLSKYFKWDHLIQHFSIIDPHPSIQVFFEYLLQFQLEACIPKFLSLWIYCGNGKHIQF